MNVSEAVRTRRSVRSFLDRQVPLESLHEVVELAARAPSGGNLQPWSIYVLSGAALARFRDGLHSAPQGKPADYEVYPPNLWDPHRTERFDVGEQMYALLGVERQDKTGRLRWFSRNYQFFGAPAALFCFVDRRMGSPQWSDLGMYLQTVMLLLRERGLDSCAQECWALYHQAVTAFVDAPAEMMLFCGMAIGYADPDAPVNRLESRRLPIAKFARFIVD